MARLYWVLIKNYQTKSLCRRYCKLKPLSTRLMLVRFEITEAKMFLLFFGGEE